MRPYCGNSRSSADVIRKIDMTDVNFRAHPEQARNSLQALADTYIATQEMRSPGASSFFASEAERYREG